MTADEGETRFEQQGATAVPLRINLLEYDSAWPFLACGRDKRLMVVGPQPFTAKMVLPVLRQRQVRSLPNRVT